MSMYLLISSINYKPKCSKNLILDASLLNPLKRSLVEIKVKINAVCAFRNGLCLVSGNSVMSSWTPLQSYSLRKAKKGKKGSSCSEEDAREFQK